MMKLFQLHVCNFTLKTETSLIIVLYKRWPQKDNQFWLQKRCWQIFVLLYWNFKSNLMESHQILMLVTFVHTCSRGTFSLVFVFWREHIMSKLPYSCRWVAGNETGRSLSWVPGACTSMGKCLILEIIQSHIPYSITTWQAFWRFKQISVMDSKNGTVRKFGSR